MKKYISALLFSLICLALCACGTQSLSDNEKGPDFASISKSGEWDLSYAKMYSVEEYGAYQLVTINDELKYLIVPEGENTPSNLPEDITVLKKPLSNVYLASSAVMDMICAISADDYVRLSGTKRDDWCIDKAAELMDEGKMLYAGKYSEPDFELILSKNCSLAIENTMIFHSPQTKEKLEELGIPVLVEQSSYEEHPLGRLEWIRLYGLLFDRQSEADAFFEKSLSMADEYIAASESGKKIAFFYVTASGAVSVKKPQDYMAKIIRMAGGEYVPGNVDEDEKNALSTINMQMEEFYADAKDADILIYNSTINDDVDSVQDILSKSDLFKDFKAVKDNRVYETGANFFQESTGVCSMIKDVNIVVNDGSEDGLYFLTHLK